MRSLKFIIIFLLFIIINFPLILYGQYTGGSGGGFSIYISNQITCPPVIYPDIFAGGIEDGYNQTGITQVVCPPVIYPDIFAGGIEDGYNQTGITQVVCPPVIYPDIFAGGIEDGEASVTIFPACAPTVDFIADNLIICEGDTVNFTNLSSTGWDSWTWTFEGGTPSSSTLKDPIVVYNTPGVYSVTLLAHNSSNSLSTVKINYITVNERPVITASGSPSDICSGSSTVLSATSSLGSTSFSWSSGLGNTPNVSVTPAITTYYTVTGTASNGCTNTAIVLINVNPAPNVIAVASPSNICLGESVTITASGADNYVWSNGLGTNSYYILTPSASSTYTVTGTNSYGCSDTAIVSIAVYSSIAIDISANPSSICYGENTLLSVSGASSYTWSHGLGNSSSVNVTPLATTTYTVTGSIGMCSNTASITVSVKPIPSVNANANPSSICLGEYAELTATGASTYNWSGGLGSSSTIMVSPSVSTTYTVTGYDNSCYNTATVTINITPPPNITLTASPDSICIGSNTTLIASGASNYIWSHGLGTNPNITISPTATTTYTVTGSNGSCSGTSFITVTVTNTPTIIASASPMNVCTGGSTTIAATGGTTYIWTDGVNNYSGNDITVYPTATTTYSVTGTSGSCSGTSFITVTVNNTPTVVASASPMNVCTGSSTTLSASGATTYQWTDGTNNYSGNNITVYPTATTTYSVTGTSGSCSGTSFITVTVNPIPILVINAVPSEICNGESSIISASGATTYIWSNGATGSSITVTPTVTTTYTVTGTNASCTSSATVVINVSSPANANINPVNNLCDNQSPIVLSAATSGGIWLGSGIIDPLTGLFNPTIAGEGTHTITYMITGQCGDTATIDITIYPSPNAIAYATDETCFNGNDGKAWVEVTDGTPPYSYLWNTFHTLSSLSDLAPGVYYVTVTDLHNCIDKDSVIVGSGIEECLNYHVYVPNVFAPNNMGNSENETIRVYGKGIVSIDFSIFDRWGNLVFHTTDMEQSWDGMYKGEPALTGDYTYMLRVNFYNGKQETVSGHILLIR